MRSFLYTLFIIGFLGTVGASLYYLYAKGQEPRAETQAVKPFRTTIVDKTLATGSILPRKEILIKSQVSGVVEELWVLPGDIVKEGQKIALIKLLADPREVNNAQSRIRQNELRLEKIRLDYERAKTLHEKNIIPESELDTAELDYQLAREELDTAKSNLELILSGFSEKLANSSTIVTATSAGMVLDRPVELGDFVIESNTFNEGTTIVTVADMADMIFEGSIEEADAGRLKEGMPLEITIGALPNEVFNARLDFISPKGLVEENRVKFEIEASLESRPDVFVRAGYSATAEIIFEKREDVLSVREADLEFRDGKAFARVADGTPAGTVREVATALSDGINIEIKAGIGEEETLLIPVSADS